jgi:hypothetical protein
VTDLSEEGVRLAQKMQRLAPALLWEYHDKRLKLAQLLGQLHSVFLTLVPLSEQYSTPLVGWRDSSDVATRLAVGGKVMCAPPGIFS